MPLTFPVTNQSATRCLLVVSLLWLESAAFCETPSAFKADSAESFPVNYGELIVAPVKVFGKQHEFALDTGATVSLLDSSLREQLGTPVGQVVINTPANNQTVDKYLAPPMRVGRTDFQSARFVICTDLTNVRSAYGLPINGFLGMDFLRSRILRINSDEGHAHILAEFHSDGGHAERIRFHNDCPCILLWLPEIGFQSFLIDTGSTGVLSLESKLYHVLLSTGDMALRTKGSAAIAGENVAHERGIMRCLKIGPHPVFNVSVSKASRNTVGMRFLMRFDATLDFPNQTAYFSPGKRFHLPEERDRSGLAIDRSDGKTFVFEVEPNSPAAKVGIQEKDLLLHLDGLPMTSLRLTEVRRRLCRKDVEVQLTLERNGVRQDVSLLLSNDPDPFPEELPRTAAKPFPDDDE